MRARLGHAVAGDTHPGRASRDRPHSGRPGHQVSGDCVRHDQQPGAATGRTGRPRLSGASRRLLPDHRVAEPAPADPVGASLRRRVGRTHRSYRPRGRGASLRTERLAGARAPTGSAQGDAAAGDAGHSHRADACRLVPGRPAGRRCLPGGGRCGPPLTPRPRCRCPGCRSRPEEAVHTGHACRRGRRGTEGRVVPSPPSRAGTGAWAGIRAGERPGLPAGYEHAAAATHPERTHRGGRPPGRPRRLLAASPTHRGGGQRRAPRLRGRRRSRRRSGLTAAGWTVLSVSPQRLRDDPSGVLREIEAAFVRGIARQAS